MCVCHSIELQAKLQPYTSTAFISRATACKVHTNRYPHTLVHCFNHSTQVTVCALKCTQDSSASAILKSSNESELSVYVGLIREHGMPACR
jgi:hypothetical protein